MKNTDYYSQLINLKGINNVEFRKKFLGLEELSDFKNKINNEI